MVYRVRSKSLTAFLLKIILILSLSCVALNAAACGDSGGDDDDDDSDDDTASTSEGLVVLNEIDCHGRDWVEMVNTTEADIDISGWYVADKMDDATHQYAIPSGTTIAPAEHFVVKQEKDTQEGFSFGIKCGADTVYLLDTELNIVDYVEVGDAPDGSTWGRLPDTTGDWQETSPTQGETNQEPSSTSSILFNPLAVSTIDLTLPVSSLDSLAADPYSYVEGQIQVTTTEGSGDLMDVGIRLKSGESYENIEGKAAFKIKINEIDSSARLFGLKGFSLNNMINDPSMMSETLAYMIFREVEVPAVRTGYAWVTLNGEDRGLYVTVENYDDIFTTTHFDNTQHVYEGSSDLEETEIAQFDVDEGDTSDMSDLLSLLDAVNNTADSDWLSTVGGLADLDQFADLWAVENYIGHSDGYALNANNYFLHSSNDGFFTMMPWGTDSCFTDKPAFPDCTSVLCVKCTGLTGCLSKYDSALSSVVTAVDEMDIDTVISDISGVISSYAEDDPFLPVSYSEYQAAVEAVRTYLNARPTEAVTD